MSVNFKSVGEIIGVGRIALALALALTDSRGSAKEYQGLVKELEAFDQTLLQVAVLWQNYEDSPELEALGRTTKEVVKDWRDTLLALRLKVDKKYGASLCPGGSGNQLRDVSKKWRWLTEKEDLLDLRRKLRSARDTLIVLILAAIGTSNRLTSTLHAARAELVHGLLQDSIEQTEKQMVQLTLMDSKLDSQAETSKIILATAESGFKRLAQLYTIATNMRNVLVLLNNSILSLQATPRGLCTHWPQAPVTLEDALGCFVPIPLELVNSWDMFDTILIKRFEKHPGHSKLLRGEFAIEEGATGREIDRRIEFTMLLHPGEKIDMSISFREASGSSNHCPRCGTQSATSSEVRTQCTSCKGWFRRVTEVGKAATVHDEAVEGDKGVNSNGRARPSRSSPYRGPIPRPADFKRVRMLRYEGVMNLASPIRNVSARMYHESRLPGLRLSCSFNGCTRTFLRQLELSRPYPYRREKPSLQIPNMQ